MRGIRPILLLTAGLLAGCDHTDRVLFVTSTSLGIDVDPQLATTSIAYDRTEGFIGPRFENGTIPPVIGSVGVGGDIFSPRIQQLYATGDAAVNAVRASDGATNPDALRGNPANSRMVFFGTTTTLGLKASFTGSAVSSLNFGFKRKEFSLIPLAAAGTGNGTTYVYPSVLASIDSTTKVAANNTGLTSKQFFATGVAAEGMAADPEVQGAFRKVAANAVEASLTPQEEADNKAVGAQNAVTQGDNIKKLDDAVTTNGALDPSKLGALVDKANTSAKNRSVGEDLKATPDLATLNSRLNSSQALVNKLLAAMP